MSMPHESDHPLYEEFSAFSNNQDIRSYNGNASYPLTRFALSIHKWNGILVADDIAESLIALGHNHESAWKVASIVDHSVESMRMYDKVLMGGNPLHPAPKLFSPKDFGYDSEVFFHDRKEP